MPYAITQRAEELDFAVDDEALADVARSYRPVVMRGLARDWPAVRAGHQSDEALARYLASFDNGRPIEVLLGPPEIRGRFFYDGELTGCNFQKRHGTISALLGRLLQMREASSPDALYAGAAATGDHLPGWNEQNALPFMLPTAVARVWIGNSTRIAPHFDEASNIAVVVAGRRRFTMFPPEQFENLYVGPLHFTIAGPPVSLVDPDNPDLDRYPRYAEALKHGVFAELEPGDAIYIPPIWWHSVSATAPFNVMVNFWWEAPDAVSPLEALMRSILSIRDLPKPHRDAWRRWFERYVFDDDASDAVAHLPEHVRKLPRPDVQK